MIGDAIKSTMGTACDNSKLIALVAGAEYACNAKLIALLAGGVYDILWLRYVGLAFVGVQGFPCP